MKGDSDFWVPDGADQFPLNVKKRKRKARSKTLEYNGWASTVLIDFLVSLGRDTSKKLSENDVANIVKEYINNNKLINPEKKKRVMCDEKLFALFGKKTIPRVKIQNLLELHFSENQYTSESEDESQYDSEEEGVKSVQVGNKGSKAMRKHSSQKQKVPEHPKSCFASVIPANIKLVYLKKSLLQELAKVSGSFQDKVTGCFVRIKSDPNDYLQKNSHQLQQIIGITSKSDNLDSEIQLRLSNYFRDVPLRQLSDDNFTEEECADLHERVKAGELKRPVVVELEAKAKILHEYITKHWISKELSLLQTLIDRANEKGWRREMFSYLERKSSLERPDEREKLLSEIPKVIADALEIESTEPVPENIEESSLPENTFRADTIDSNFDNGQDSNGFARYPSFDQRDLLINAKANEDVVNGATFVKNADDLRDTDHDQEVAHPVLVIGEETDAETPPALPTEALKESSQTPTAIVIELSDDEEEAEGKDSKIQNPDVPVHPDDTIWYYSDPQGEVQGPFPLTSLKRWHDDYYFDESFRVWKIGQNPSDAILLSDVLSRAFPC